MTTTYWTVAELARRLSLSYDTVQKWPYRGYGPIPYVLTSGRKVYDPAIVAAWSRSKIKVLA